MRFSLLALLVTLPAVAYAAVSAEQLPVGHGTMACVGEVHICTPYYSCCTPLRCVGNPGSGVKVRSQSIWPTLRVADWDARGAATNGATRSVFV
jgi:hypothetical protein